MGRPSGKACTHTHTHQTISLSLNYIGKKREISSSAQQWRRQDTFFSCMLRVSCFPSDNVRKSLMPVFLNNIPPFSSCGMFSLCLLFFLYLSTLVSEFVCFLNFSFLIFQVLLQLCLVHSFSHSFALLVVLVLYLPSAFWLCLFVWYSLGLFVIIVGSGGANQINRIHTSTYLEFFMWNV